MNYIKNESGDIKVIDDKGNVKWLAPVLVNNRILMSRMKFTILENPMQDEFRSNESSKEAAAKRPRINEQK